MGVWRPIKEQRAGYLFNLSDSLRIVEGQYPNILAPLNEGVMFVASDYSGQHKEATHEAYAFLITTDRSLSEWLPYLSQFRKDKLPDNRRISFKKLREPVRWKSLPAFLEVVGKLQGNLLTVLVDRKIGSFMSGGARSAIEAFPDCFPAEAKHGTVEKMLRLASFMAFIIAGLRQEGQTSQWISDHDETLDTHDKREQFARLASYLTFGLTGWRNTADHMFATTESPNIPYWSEDVAAIPDLVAGAYCQMSACLPSFFGVATWTKSVNPNLVTDDRVRLIGDWLATGKRALKHVLLRLELDGIGSVRASAQAFKPSVVPHSEN